jgi:hypothetical protein
MTGVQESRITPGYAYATWEAMQRAVESLEYEVPDLSVFQTNQDKTGFRREQNGREKSRISVDSPRRKKIGASGFEPLITTPVKAS